MRRHAGSDDPIVVSFGNVSLRRSHLDTLSDGCFLSDAVIAFCLELLFHDSLEHLPQFVVLDGAACQLACSLPPESLGAVFGTQYMHFPQTLLAVVNHGARVDVAESGAHWTLVHAARFRDSDGESRARVVHLDSASPNSPVPRSLLRALEALSGYTFEEMNEPSPRYGRQRNAFDCGVFVVAALARLARGVDVHALGDIDDAGQVACLRRALRACTHVDEFRKVLEDVK